MLFHKMSVDLILNSLNVTADVSKRKPFSYCFNFTAPNLLFSNLIIPWLSCSQSQHFTVRRHNLSFSYYVQQDALVILIQLELLKLKIRPKEKLQSPQLDFSASDAAREKSSRKRRLNADNETVVSEKEDDEYADFKKFRAVAKHDEFKFDLPENLAQYTNDHFNKFIQEKDLQERILVENPVPLNLQSLRKMDAFMRDLIFEKKGGSRLKFSQAATKITRCYWTFI